MSLKETVTKEIAIQSAVQNGRLRRTLDPVGLTIQVAAPVLAVVAALLLTALILVVSGKDVGLVYGEMWSSAFGENFSETIVKAIPLTLTGLAVTVAFRAKLWNIGADGQFYAGVLGATALALTFPDLPALIIVPLMIAGGMIAGAVWAAVPGLLRAWLDVNEIITTLMLNYVAVLLSDYFIFGPWRDPKGFNFPVTASFSDAARLPIVVDGTRIHFGLVLALIATVLVWLINRTKWGFELKVMGDSAPAARYAGINLKRNIVLVFVVSGALAGLAGMCEVTGVAGRLQQNISPGYGYTAVIVAWLARLNPWAIVVVAVLFGGLVSSGFTMQRIGISSSLVTLLQGIVLFMVLAGESLSRRLLYSRALSRTPQGA